MKDVLFRGKRVDTGEWVEGLCSKFGNPGEEEMTCIKVTTAVTHLGQVLGYSYIPFRVDPETIGQYTGLNDKNSKKIFKGDIVKVRQDGVNGTGIIGFEHGAFIIYPMTGSIYERTLWEYWYNDWDVEVIGNKTDNPELKPELRFYKKGV